MQAFELVAGHVIIESDGGRLLVDTGSPVSFGRIEAATVLGHLCRFHPAHGPCTIDTIIDDVRSLPGVAGSFTLDGLLGADELWGLELDLDFKHRTLHLRDATSPRPPRPSNPARLIPQLEVAIHGLPMRAVIDTGARISYLDRSFLSGVRPDSSAPDFYVGIGRYTVNLHPLTVSIGGRSVSSRFARPPDAVQATLRALGARGIIGTDVMSALGRVQIRLAP